MLGGFYFIVSFVLNSWQNDFCYYLSLFLLLVLVFFVVLLFVKKSLVFLEKFTVNNPRVSLYLKAVGAAQYFDIFFGMVPSIFVDTQTYIPVYFKYAAMFYFVILIASLICATYLSVVKYRKHKATGFENVSEKVYEEDINSDKTTKKSMKKKKL